MTDFPAEELFSVTSPYRERGMTVGGGCWYIIVHFVLELEYPK